MKGVELRLNVDDDVVAHASGDEDEDEVRRCVDDDDCEP